MHFLFGSNFRDKVTRWFSSGCRAVISEGRTNAGAYLVSLAGVGLATLLRIGLDPVLGDHHPFTLYFASVAIAAWYGGFGPAVLATVLSYFAADWFFIIPRFEINLPTKTLTNSCR